MLSQPSASSPPIAFALCVEAGGFEPMVIRAAQSLRKFGGKFSNCKVYAVTPRAGASLCRSTLKSFDELGVEYLNVRPANSYSWYPWMNKPLTVLEVQKKTTTEQICFVDSDMIVIGQPDLMLLDDQTDFTACVPDKNMGSASDDDENAPFWKELCRTLGTRFEDLPRVYAHRDKVDIRLYFNSGIFTFRKSSNFADIYHRALTTALDAKLSSPVSNVYFHEQAIIGAFAVKEGLRWKALPHEYNYAMGRKILDKYEPQKVRDGIILHYHDMMWPDNWPVLMERLKVDRPDVHDWLSALGPLQLPGSSLQKLTSKVYKSLRKKKFDRYRNSCRVVK